MLSAASVSELFCSAPARPGALAPRAHTSGHTTAAKYAPQRTLIPHLILDSEPSPLNRSFSNHTENQTIAMFLSLCYSNFRFAPRTEAHCAELDAGNLGLRTL